MTTRRRFLQLGSASMAACLCPPLLAAEKARILFVHGRSQQGRDPVQIKSEWMSALRQGTAAAGLTLPSELTVDLPFYGDTLNRLTQAVPLVSEIRTRGSQDDEFMVFQAEFAEALRQKAGVTDAEVDAEYGDNPRQRGPLNWEWVHAILRALDKHAEGVGQATLETFTRDVFLYSTRAGVRDEIDRIVSTALTTEPTVVVGHSLGTLVAYSVLTRDTRVLQIPAFITIGSPLGVRNVRNPFRPLKRPPVGVWYNAFDPRDVVALYPLDVTNFPVTPEIVNNGRVNNQTSDRHGISGYLNDPNVARRIVDLLT
jgi:pimeloyl-ACP methyl ester carboxylesterase